MEAQRFTYKPALLKPAQTWELEGPILRGPGQVVDLRDVSDAGMSEHVIKRTRMRRLELVTSKGKLHLGLNQDEHLPAWDQDRAAHRALCSAIAERLAEVHPDMAVAMGTTGGARWGMFVVGALSLLVGLGIGIAAMITGVSGDRMAAAAVPMLGLILLGFVVVRSHAPWKPVPKVPVALVPAILEALDGVGSDRADDPTEDGGAAPS